MGKVSIIMPVYNAEKYLGEAIESVRKRLQKTMPKNLRKYFKHSRKLILSRYSRLNDEKKRECDLMLLYNDDLRKAHFLMEKFYDSKSVRIPIETGANIS